MIEKIKAWLDTAKGVLLYVITPLVFIAGYIWVLLGKERRLEDKIAELTQDERQKAQEAQVKEDENEVNSTNSDYARLRDEYLREHGTSGHDVPAGDPSRGSNDSSKG